MKVLAVFMLQTGLHSHVFEPSLTDLWNDRVAFRKFKLFAEEAQGKTV